VRRQKKIIALPCAKKKHTANHDFAVCHKKTHGKVFLCRVLKKSTRQTMTLPCALVLPCVFLSTLGKNHVCRVPVNLHTANYGAHGKIEVSGSERDTTYYGEPLLCSWREGAKGSVVWPQILLRCHMFNFRCRLTPITILTYVVALR